MKTKITLIIIAGLFSIYLPAQTVTSDIIPEIGDEIHLIYCNNEGVQEGESGDNIIWDFTGLLPNPVQEYDEYVYKFIDPATSPYADLFPQAELGMVQWDTGYAYYANNESAIETIGFGIEINGSDFIASYTDPEKAWAGNFPFSYGQSWDDSFVYAQSGMGFTDTVTGNKTVEVDGFGTLKLPDGKTYDNVLRIKEEKIIHLSGGLYTIQYRYFWWFSPEYKLWLLEIGYDNNDNNGWVNIGVYYADNPLPLGISDHRKNLKCSISPNPAKGYIWISIPENHSRINSVQIFDQFLRLVKTINFSSLGNQSMIRVSTNDLSKGFYIVKVADQDRLYTSKLVVE